MFQYRTASSKDNTKHDLIIVALFVLIIAFLRKIIDMLATLPSPFNAIVQGLVFLVLVVLCYLIFRMRICDYRYTIINHQPAEGETNIFGKEEPYPWSEGTVHFERMVANKGKLLETVKPEELVAMLEPGEVYGEKIPLSRMDNYSPKSAKKSYTLVYRRDGKVGGVRLFPSQEFVDYINEAIAGAK